MPAELKFCKDCEHHICDEFFRHICTLRKLHNVVTGERLIVECDNERSTGDCGPDAKNFKPKQETSK